MNENEKTPAGQPAGPEEQAVDHRSKDADAAALTALRQQKTLEYLQAALAIEDPLIANVSLLNADLMFYAHEIRRMIGPALKMAPADVNELANLFPAMEGALRVHRQSERLSVFIHRLKREQAAAAKARAAVAVQEVEFAKAAMS
jgi:hypothetical protein